MQFLYLGQSQLSWGHTQTYTQKWREGVGNRERKRRQEEEGRESTKGKEEERRKREDGGGREHSSSRQPTSPYKMHPPASNTQN